MPIQIDRMDTTIEITPASPPRAGGERAAGAPAEPPARQTLATLVGEVMREELAGFLRNRGIE